MCTPPFATVVTTGDMSLVSVDKPNQFPLVAAQAYDAPRELDVTGTVFPDIAREIPVISLASGRVVDIKARLDDNVKKGQLLLKIQSPDSTGAFDTYLKAVNDERMNNKAYMRAKDSTTTAPSRRPCWSRLKIGERLAGRSEGGRRDIGNARRR